VNSLGTADPAVLAGHVGLGDAEGIHLVLRREGEGDRWAGRRRRAAHAGTQETAAQESAAQESAPAGRHTAARSAAALGGAGQPQGPSPQPPSPEVREEQPQAPASQTRTEQPPVPAPGRREDQPRVRASAVREEAGRPRVFVLRGGDAGTLARQLDDIAASAPALSDDELETVARRLAVSALEAGDHPDPLRVALTAASPRQLAGQAGEAARLLRASGPQASLAGGPDLRISAGACGAVVVLFPGTAESPAGQPALLAASLEALDTLDAFGVRPTTGVGYSLAEITGLAWAGCIPAAEAARLVAQCSQVLRACACGTAAMARVTVEEDLARALAAPGRLHIAAYEGPRTHVLAGSTAGVRELARRAAMLKVGVEILGSAAAMHSPGMARCAAPLRSVLAATSFAPPRRRLISTITGRLVTAEDDLAWLLAAQVTRPVLFAQAMAQAAAAADLIVIAGPDAGLGARAAECGGVPAVAVPAVRGRPAASGGHGAPGPHRASAAQGARPGPDQVALARAVAALFAAGAITDLAPYLGQARPVRSGGTLASQTVPRMRTEPLAPARTPASGG
jgi:hypothetical protein